MTSIFRIWLSYYYAYKRVAAISVFVRSPCFITCRLHITLSKDARSELESKGRRNMKYLGRKN